MYVNCQQTSLSKPNRFLLMNDIKTPIPSYLSKFALSKRCMSLVLIQCTNTFLQCKQTLVDLSTFHSKKSSSVSIHVIEKKRLVVPCLGIGFTTICTTFRTCQVNKAKLAMDCFAILSWFEQYLEDSMGSRGGIICTSGAYAFPSVIHSSSSSLILTCTTDLVTIGKHLYKVINIVDGVFFQAGNDHIALAIFTSK